MKAILTQRLQRGAFDDSTSTIQEVRWRNGREFNKIHNGFVALTEEVSDHDYLVPHKGIPQTTL